MKVKSFVEAEVEVEVSAAEFIAELRSLPIAESMALAVDAINASYSVLRRIDDKLIAQLNEHQRRVINEALARQADRYLTPLPEPAPAAK